MAGRVAYTGGIVRNGLVLHLDAAKRDSYPKTGTSWTDLSGRGNTGTLIGGAGFNSNNGGHITLDGIDEYIANTNIPNFNVGCIDIWFKPNSTVNSTSAAASLIQLKYGDVVNSAWYIALGSATGLLANEYITIANVTNDTRTAVADGGSLLANGWYNLVFNWETNQYKIYINNSVKTTITANGGISQLTTPNRYYIGVVNGDAINPLGGFFSGAIGHTKLYNRPLTSAELLQNYNALKGRYI
jgi:hypothetical protein